jgi:hypothetical protein
MALEARNTMTIRYDNGQTFEAVLLSKKEDSMRVVLEGSDDVLELKQICGAWISETCEPVQVEYAWMRQTPKPQVTEEECICSPELAAHLIELLNAGDEQSESDAAPMPRVATASGSHNAV